MKMTPEVRAEYVAAVDTAQATLAAAAWEKATLRQALAVVETTTPLGSNLPKIRKVQAVTTALAKLVKAGKAVKTSGTGIHEKRGEVVIWKKV